MIELPSGLILAEGIWPFLSSLLGLFSKIGASPAL